MPLRLPVCGLEPHVGLRGEVVEKSHGFINLATTRTNVSLPVRPPVTRVPARCCVCLSSYPSKFRKPPVQREVTDQIVHLVRYTMLLLQVCCMFPEACYTLFVTVSYLRFVPLRERRRWFTLAQL